MYKKIIICLYNILIFFINYTAETIRLSNIQNLYVNIVHMPDIFNAQIYIDQIFMCVKFFKLTYFNWILDKINYMLVNCIRQCLHF